MVVSLLVTIVGSILVTWLLPMMLDSEPPYGAVVDIAAGTFVAVIWVIVTYQYLAPWIGLTGWLRLVGSAADAIGFAAVMLWILRRVKG